MAFDFTIPDEMLEAYHAGIDAVLNKYSQDCRLIYPPAMQECPNCIFDPFTERSSNRYKAGGPTPFSFGVCPYCEGEGNISVAVEENIKLRVYWNPKEWEAINIQMDVPAGSIQTKGYSSDLPKIEQCQYLIATANLEGLKTYRFVRLAEPTPTGLKNQRYLLTMWKRA